MDSRVEYPLNPAVEGRWRYGGVDPLPACEYHYPDLRFDGSPLASSSWNVFLSMWENLTSHETWAVFVFTYCHVDREPIWDGSSTMPKPAVTSSCHSREHIARGKHLTQVWNIHMDVWRNIPGACLHRYLDISSVFHDTVIPDVAFVLSSSPPVFTLTRLGHTPLFWS